MRHLSECRERTIRGHVQNTRPGPVEPDREGDMRYVALFVLVKP